MSDGAMIRGAADTSRLYFFLSYAHSDPLAGSPEANPDKLVGEFFGDLVGAVRRHASRPAKIVPGFCDQETPVGSNWKEFTRQALGVAQVFVPLYSAAYIVKSWPGQEWACFRRRLELAGVDDPGRRFVPILWTPLWQTRQPPGLQEALDLGASNPAYRENGLRALLKIGQYRGSYQAVVDSVAQRIVAVAEETPIEPSVVPDIDEMESPFAPQPLSVFVIETAVPTASSIAAERDPRGYGESGADWRPFPRQELSLAEYAREVARRLDFRAEVSGIKAVSDPAARRPGIILIDPWFISEESGRMALESAVEDLPRWVLPLVVLDQPEDASTQKLADQVREILNAVGAVPTHSSLRAVKGVSSLDNFVSIVPVLVAEAERQYLRYSSGRYRSGRVPSPPSSTRPSLRHPARPKSPASTPDGPASTPDS